MVLITSSTPRRRRTAAGGAQAPPAMAGEEDRDRERTAPLAGATPRHAPVAPARSCPSAPMFKTPARNARATASPVRMRGVARTSVAEQTRSYEPIEPPPERGQRRRHVVSAKGEQRAEQHQCGSPVAADAGGRRGQPAHRRADPPRGRITR